MSSVLFGWGLFVKEFPSTCICRGEVERLAQQRRLRLSLSLFVTQTNPTLPTKEEEEKHLLLLLLPPLLAYRNDVVMIADRQILFDTELPHRSAFVVLFPFWNVTDSRANDTQHSMTTLLCVFVLVSQTQKSFGFFFCQILFFFFSFSSHSATWDCVKLFRILLIPRL